MNKSRLLLPAIILLTTILFACKKEKPKILIIGDSISIGYMPYVKDYFLDKAILSHNPGNAQHTGTGLKKVEEWIGDEQWDIIQFNWGLWDLCYRHPDSKVQGNRDKVNGKITYPIDDYISNLDSIVSIMNSKTNAQLIFVTTSYVPENEAGRFKEDAIKYNDAAKTIMKKYSVLINNIYEPSALIHKEFGKGNDDVHYTKEGYEKLGELVTNFLEAQL